VEKNNNNNNNSWTQMAEKKEKKHACQYCTTLAIVNVTFGRQFNIHKFSLKRLSQNLAVAISTL